MIELLSLGFFSFIFRDIELLSLEESNNQQIEETDTSILSRVPPNASSFHTPQTTSTKYASPNPKATGGRDILWRCLFMSQYDQINGERPRNCYHNTVEQARRCERRGFCSGILEWKLYE
ncbi:hypothetical protein RclHR1_01630022 [Rhizophagus clarus]|uniref:Uncharacterized protein n=1 Tax=Rhizophagus clarus TaxID=94130 RepID=A0A2Z6QWI9_9GLOM|nr:hypothetical protein RclHR1_01630022 [Rhizophagus clarus]